MACLEGFEPPTYWFVASHSIQLSYKHIYNMYKYIILVPKSQVLSVKFVEKCILFNNYPENLCTTENNKFPLDILKIPWYNYICCETLAQSVEHTPFKRRVEGSNPSCLTTHIIID